jgi:hypothetical protein
MMLSARYVIVKIDKTINVSLVNLIDVATHEDITFLLCLITNLYRGCQNQCSTVG